MKKSINLITSFAFSFAFAYPAQADQKKNSVYSINFKMPSGNIVCAGDIKEASHGMEPWNGVSCFVEISNRPIKKRPKDCELDWGGMFTLPQKGETIMECYGDFPFEASHRVLNYGEVIEGSGWKCFSKKKGLLCINKEGHGFRIRRNQQVLF